MKIAIKREDINMRMVCISKNSDIAVGLRLAGVESFYIKESKDILLKIEEVLRDENVGILNVTEEVYEIAKGILDRTRETRNLPLIVKIPNSK